MMKTTEQFFHPNPDLEHVYQTGIDTSHSLDKPVRARQDCIKTGWHGSGIKFGDVTVCFHCNTRVTEEDLERRRTPPRPIVFDAWLTDTTRHYVVPPENVVRVCVSEHEFNCYVSIEDLVPNGEIDEGQVVRRWVHRKGSSTGHGKLGAAIDHARLIWQRLALGCEGGH